MGESPPCRSDPDAELEDGDRPCKVERFKCKAPPGGTCLVQARNRRVRRPEWLEHRGCGVVMGAGRSVWDRDL